jgi:hypothetical protein
MSAVAKVNSRPFVTTLRTGGRSVDLSRSGDPVLNIRVEMPEVWDTILITASPNEPVVSVKRAALEALDDGRENAADFVIKLRGWEVLDEGATLHDAGAIDGSIFLLTHRRRRPVR